MKRAALILAASVALAGCATKMQAAADLEQAQRIVPTCAAGADCDAKWDAAQRWVVKNAGFTLQTATPQLLQTHGPALIGGSATTLLAATVTREPDLPGRFRIVADINCGNPFGCHPEWQSALLDFNRTVSAARAQ
jgi:hypothetical protein